ncbi:head-tail connector protein [Pedobacter duraquae]|uniref:Putative phiE125 gp8 family phage protein n=1 Tax=Pedobacter duraquae TaxID=425511 RepID=A0A4R6IIS0_9SPHI|nr:head-tail connector protein [Pedobacter duraquae]TDO21889.1 putative phiE125 gp8 family phage protein [Pedobacter duraquae]
MAEIVILSLPVAKAWLRMDPTYDLEDALLTSLIDAAVRQCEKYTGLTFGLKSLRAYTDKSVYEMTGTPVFDITSIKDLSGNNVTYQRKGFQHPTLYFGSCEDKVITYVAGYGNNLPEDLRTAVKMTMATMYENRENFVIASRGDSLIQLPTGATDLMRPYSRSGGLFI